MKISRRIYCLTAIGLFFMLVSRPTLQSSAATANGPELWSATYNGPDNLEDTIRAMAVDDQGNVYVTGVSQYATSNQSNIVTIKYSPAGVPLWTRIYDGPGNSSGTYLDEGRDIAVDGQGYVYVTGASTSSTDFDYITLRYTPDGDLDWEQRYSPPSVVNGDVAYALALNENYVYVTGTSADADNQIGITTVVYTLAGAYVREMRILGYNVCGIVADTSGNIYVVGQVYQAATGFDFLTVKYGPDGTQLWAKTYDGSENQADNPIGLAVDGDGNVYVAGDSEHIENYQSETYMAAVKYSPGGSQMWAKRYSGVNNGGAHAMAMGIDPSGDIYVTGSVYGWVGGWDYGTIKYDTNGNFLWDRLYNKNFNNSAYALKLDNHGNIYITGDGGTLKYDPAGNVLWLYEYSQSITASELAVDQAGNVYICGESNQDYATIKYPPNPTLFVSVEDAGAYEGNYPDDRNTVDFNISLSEAVDYDVAITYHTVDGTAISSSDYVTATSSLTLHAGETSGTIQISTRKDTVQDEGDRYFFLSLNPVANARVTRNQARGTVWEDDLNLQHWVTRTTGGDPNVYQDVVGLAVDSAGNSYILVKRSDSTNSTLIKYDPDGGYVWGQSYPGQAYDMLLVQDSFIYIAGVTHNNHDAFIAKYSTSGDKLWDYIYDSSAHDDDELDALAADPWGNIVAVGTSVLPHHAKARFPDFLIVKLAPDGSLAWTKTYSGTTNSWDQASGIGTDSLGGIYITGESGITEYGNSIRVIKYTSDGVLTWEASYVYQNNTNAANMVEDTAVDPGGNVYIAGYVIHEGHLWGIGLIFNPSGGLAWEHECPAGGCGYINRAKALTLNNNGDVVFVGFGDSGNGVEVFGIGEYASNGSYRWDDGINAGGAGLDVSTDDENNVAATGSVVQVGWGTDAITRVYNASGKLIWQQTYTGIVQTSNDYGSIIAVDVNGELYVTGRSGDDIATINYGAVPLPLVMSISDSYVRETITGTTEAAFTVKLSQPQDSDITFNYSTFEGTAAAGQDYLSSSGTVTVPTNSTSARFRITIHGDANPEPDEFFFVNLSSPSAGSFAKAQAKCVIWDSRYILQFLPVTVR